MMSDITSGGTYYGIEFKCAVCGKNKMRSKTWTYKRQGKHGNLYFCGWNCMSAYDKEHPKKESYMRRI